MRVLLVREHFYPDDTGPTVLSDLFRRLIDRHPEISLEVIASDKYYNRPGVRIPRDLSWEGIHLRRIRAPRTKHPRTLCRLLRGCLLTTAFGWALLQDRRPYDVVFMGSDPPMIPAAVLPFARRRRIPCAYYIGDLFPDMACLAGQLSPQSPIIRLARWLQRRWLQGAARVIVVGRCMKDRLGRDYSVPEDKVEVITNPVDPAAIPPIQGPTSFRKEHGLEGFLVLYSGNLGAHHRFEDVIEAARLLSEREPSVTFAFVGEGVKKAPLMAMVRQLGLGNVRFFPPVPRADLPDLLASADAALVTLEPGMEGLAVPSKFYNLLAAGRPVVAIMDETAEVSRALAEHGCGVRVDHFDPPAIADVISRLARDPTACRAMGRKARRAAEGEYSLDATAERLYEALRRTAGAVEPHQGSRASS